MIFPMIFPVIFPGASGIHDEARLRPAARRETRRASADRRRNRGGFTLIEALIAVAIMFISVAAMVSLWNFSFHMTTQADNEGVAYTIGRHETERIKQSGFDFAPEGTSMTYYSAQGVAHAVKQNGDRFQVTTTVTSSDTYPANDSKRTVTVTVFSLSPSMETLYHTGMMLVKAGI
jgi:Tfp pilus assembly protein PilV